MRPPGPRSGWDEWRAFHNALVTELHTHPDLLTACGAYEFIEDGFDHTAQPRWSPWTNGGCGLLARALYEWINQPRRAQWMMLGRHAHYRIAFVPFSYPHAIIRYKSDTLGWIYFDGVTITRDGADLLNQFKADRLLSRTKDSHEWMAENFGVDPFDDLMVQQVKFVLVNAFGRWPR